MDPTVCKFCALWSTVPCITCVVLRAVQAVDAPNGALATAGCEACLHCSRVTAKKNNLHALLPSTTKGKLSGSPQNFCQKKNMKTQKHRRRMSRKLPSCEDLPGRAGSNTAASLWQLGTSLDQELITPNLQRFEGLWHLGAPKLLRRA